MNRPTTRTTRIGLVAGLWLAAAVGALLLGLTAVGSIGSGLSGGDPVQPLAAEQVEAQLAQRGGPVTEAPPPPPAPAAPAAPQEAPPTVVPAGQAGSILARCEGDTPRVVSVNPAQGFEREDDDDLGPNQIEFDGDDIDILVTLNCANGVPSGEVHTKIDD
ncbi:hypothetical protein WIS52_07720 [Pseudonocardia nematodicida]|uniref:Septum formation initiator n=1 Tax=Pseudonocardia nematodicida TaxID=1206997 RepID=A0ABV1K901_9PSEU